MNEAPEVLLNEFYSSGFEMGLKKAIEILQGEDYPVSNGLVRVEYIVRQIEEEIKFNRGEDVPW